MYRACMTLLHGGVVCLHGAELYHVTKVTIATLIGVAFMAISIVELVHLTKEYLK